MFQIPCHPMPGEVEVIIIGAGAAGLGAARTLLHAGRRFVLLEARRRIGGRAWTESLGRAQSFDHGASFIHAEHANPWTVIARRLGVRTFIDPQRRHLLVAGRTATPEEFCAFLAAREAAAAEVTAAARTGRDVSIAAALTGRGPWAGQARAALAPWLLGTENEQAGVADFACAVSGRDRLVAGGYGRLVATYGRGVPVHLGATVRRISYGGRTVLVESNAGSVRAPVAIITLPTGVLAAQAVVFSPPLPDEKVRAIQALPMGALAKIGLFFAGDPFGLGDTWYLHEQCDHERVPLYLMRPGGEDMVVALVGGSLARELEQAGEEAAGAFALDSLARIFGSGVRGRCRAVRQTRWGEDVHARGSYSVARPGGSQLRRTLAEPLAGRLFFAGEACASDGWAATVAGALRTGQAAARAALAALERQGL